MPSMVRQPANAHPNGCCPAEQGRAWQTRAPRCNVLTSRCRPDAVADKARRPGFLASQQGGSHEWSVVAAMPCCYAWTSNASFACTAKVVRVAKPLHPQRSWNAEGGGHERRAPTWPRLFPLTLRTPLISSHPLFSPCRLPCREGGYNRFTSLQARVTSYPSRFLGSPPVQARKLSLGTPTT